jgi:hypothetical protein
MISINKLTAFRHLVYKPINGVDSEKSQYAIPEVDKLPLGLAVHGREKESIFRSNFFFFFLFLGKARLSPSAERFFLLIKISFELCLRFILNSLSFNHAYHRRRRRTWCRHEG